MDKRVLFITIVLILGSILTGVVTFEDIKKSFDEINLFTSMVFL